MNVSVCYIDSRPRPEDPKADYWIGLSQISGIRWEVPVTKEELEKLQPWLPKALRHGKK